MFTADHLAVPNMPMAALKRSATVTSFDPQTLLFALAVRPELQRRGILRREDEGTTLRDHLGLVRPANRVFTTS